MITMQIIKWLGYREKNGNIYEAIKDACVLNEETKEKLDRMRATLDGENGWFKGDHDD